eukprot:scaffold14350_cov98-Isochrysis_galbana.AAC.8
MGVWGSSPGPRRPGGGHAAAEATAGGASARSRGMGGQAVATRRRRGGRDRRGPIRGHRRAARAAGQSAPAAPGEKWAARTWVRKNCWSFSFAKLMHSCSNELCVKFSKPKMSSRPT